MHNRMEKMKSETNIIRVDAKSAPLITLDSETGAVYIRFSRAKIAKTIEDGSGAHIVNIDTTANGKVVGVELIGVKNFSITRAARILSERITGVPSLADAKLAAR